MYLQLHMHLSAVHATTGGQLVQVATAENFCMKIDDYFLIWDLKMLDSHRFGMMKVQFEKTGFMITKTKYYIIKSLRIFYHIIFTLLIRSGKTA